MSDPPPVEVKQSKWQVKNKLNAAYDVVIHHLSKHTGVGFVCAVAYFDPYDFFSVLFLPFHLILSSSGNWGVDLQAGSEYGYKLLFVVLLAGIFAVLLQVRLLSYQSGSRSHAVDVIQSLASRLGCVTGTGKSLNSEHPGRPRKR